MAGSGLPRTWHGAATWTDITASEVYLENHKGWPPKAYSSHGGRSQPCPSSTARLQVVECEETALLLSALGPRRNIRWVVHELLRDCTPKLKQVGSSA